MKSTKEIGKQLEFWVCEQMKEIEPNICPTKNSGGSTELEDIKSRYIMVQCKVDNSHENVIMKIKDWKKLNNALPINSTRLPLFIHQNKEGLKTVTLDAKDFFGILLRSLYQGDR